MITLAEHAFAPATLSVPPTQECAFALQSASSNAATSNIASLALAKQYRKLLEHERESGRNPFLLLRRRRPDLDEVAMALAPDPALATIISNEMGGTWPSFAITSGMEQNPDFPHRGDRLGVVGIQRDKLGLCYSRVFTQPKLALRSSHGRSGRSPQLPGVANLSNRFWSGGSSGACRPEPRLTFERGGAGGLAARQRCHSRPEAVASRHSAPIIRHMHRQEYLGSWHRAAAV